MEIQGTHGHSVNRAETRGAELSASRKPATRGSRDGDSKIHARSEELVRLAEELDRIPEVRDSEVQRVSKTLADGGYDTREAVLGAAEAILRSR